MYRKNGLNEFDDIYSITYNIYQQIVLPLYKRMLIQIQVNVESIHFLGIIINLRPFTAIFKYTTHYIIKVFLASFLLENIHGVRLAIKYNDIHNNKKI